MSNHHYQPVQPVVIDDAGTPRFRQNTIVEHLRKKLAEQGYDLNELHRDMHNAPDDDWDQFHQLIGYSTHGCPLRDEDIRDLAYIRLDRLKKGGAQTESDFFRNKLDAVRKSFKRPVADLFNIHPSDLQGG
jgi:hypothetical protein